VKLGSGYYFRTIDELDQITQGHCGSAMAFLFTARFKNKDFLARNLLLYVLKSHLQWLKIIVRISKGSSVSLSNSRIIRGKFAAETTIFKTVYYYDPN